MIQKQTLDGLPGILEISDPLEVRDYPFPDFMIIGPQRTGTTWLCECLRRHPAIFMSSPKELYFFSHLKLQDHPLYASSDLNWYVKHFADTEEEFTRKNKIMQELYGESYRPQVRGEATASYAAMEEEAIRLIYALNPDVKIIMMVRNPVDRAWSHAKKDLARDLKRPWQEVPREEFERFFTNRYQLRCGYFSKIIRRWSGVIKKKNLLIQHFEAIEKKPVKLLKTVCGFLGVKRSAKYFKHELVNRKINITEGTHMPPYYRNFLEELFSGEIKELEQRYKITFE